MTANYYNFAGTTIDPTEIANQIKTEIKKPAVQAAVDNGLDKFTVRAIARTADASFVGFVANLESHLSDSLGVSVNLDEEKFLTVFEDICDIVESQVAEIGEEDEDEFLEDETDLYAIDDEYWATYEEDYYEDEEIDPEDYDFENPRY